MRLENKRQQTWDTIKNKVDPFDLVVVGGGITGAGIFREARRAGLSVLLVEKRDFAWGTSSRSTKLVHGGLRYLKQGHLGLTRSALMEREHLLNYSQELVTPQHFLLQTWKGKPPKRWTFALGLALYNFIAGRREPLSWPAETIHAQMNMMNQEQLARPLRYFDAQADDARMVLRLIYETRQAGGLALNYCAASPPERKDGAMRGLLISDEETGQEHFVHTRAVANATGAFANNLREDEPLPVRPQRGSHLVFSAARLPIERAMMLLHPRDARPLFLVPWEGAVIFGTTDVDHTDDLDQEPRITNEEVKYLLSALHHAMPSLELSEKDIISTWSGVRPIISHGKADPTKESRDHQIWDEQGLLTITGGKLTTFRKMAFDLLEKLKKYVPNLTYDTKAPVYNPPHHLDWPERAGLTSSTKRRLLSRFGNMAPEVAEASDPGELSLIPNTRTLWAELRWAAREEDVQHLEDLLLRRVRLGLLLPDGCTEHLDRIGAICRQELNWSLGRWYQEANSWQYLWESAYSLPSEPHEEP